MSYKILETNDCPGNSSPKKHRQLILPGILIALTVAAFAVGLLFGRNLLLGEAGLPTKIKAQFKIAGKEAVQVQTVNFNLYWDVWKKVQAKHISKPVADDTLFYGSIEGLLASLKDPYSVFLKPDNAKRFSQDLAGSFSGIGAELGMKKDIVTIIAPLADSPAEKTGIKAGDQIAAVDGQETFGWTLEEAVSKIRGIKGTTVRLKIWREGFSEPQEIAIVRDTIQIKSVVWKMINDRGEKDENGQTAYLKLSHFNEDTSESFDKAVRDLTLKNPTSLILDLRNNPGGFLDTAVRVASEWIPKGAIVLEKFSDGHEETYAANGPHRLNGLKTIVLVNQGSASASEIVAGALQDYGKATVIGEKTFGKGSVQDYEQLPDGSGLKITIAEWLTPKGRRINKNGVTPDKIVTAEASTGKIQTVIKEAKPEKDLVIEEALKMVK